MTSGPTRLFFPSLPGHPTPPTWSLPRDTSPEAWLLVHRAPTYLHDLARAVGLLPECPEFLDDPGPWSLRGFSPIQRLRWLDQHQAALEAQDRHERVTLLDAWRGQVLGQGKGAQQ